MKVVSDGFFAIYVYYETMQPHHQPHCHIRTPDSDTVVFLPLLKPLTGKGLSRRAKSLLRNNLDELCDAWNKLNPEREIK
jgi:hypothetical protein